MPDPYFTVRFRVNQFQFSKFQQAQDIDISHKMVIQEFCKQCENIEITVFDKKKKKSVTFPKGFLVKEKK